MDTDDLPPAPRENDNGFAGELGRTVASFTWIAVFIAIAGVVLWLVTRWLR
jgi:hypothetical protein